MALSLNQAQDIVQKLSNEQLMHAYTSGTVPQFVVFSEMQRRQNMANTQAKMPTQTVAEKMIGRPEHEGLGAMMPQQPPQMAARGGITRASTLDMGYSENLPEEAKKAIAMRLRAMKDLEEPMEFASGGPVSYAEGSDGYPVPDKDRPPTSAEIADMIIHPMIQAESSGRQFDSKGNPLRSRAGAFGIMQVKPATGKEAATKAGFAWEPDKFYKDPAYNTKVGRAYLIQMLDKYGDTEKALAAYNWGPTNLSKALASAQESGRDWKSYLPGETSAYLGKILGSRQALLPPRQDAQGADTQVPEYQKPYVDPTFAGGKGSDPTIYNNVNQYPYERRGLDSLGQILGAAKQVQKTRFSDGGPLRLEGGSDDQPVSAGDVKRTPYGNMLTLPNGEEVIIPPGMSVDDAKRMFSRTPMSTPGVNPQPTPVRTDSQFVPEKIYDGTKGLIGRMWDSIPTRQEAGEAVDRLGTGIKGIYDKAVDAKRKLESGRMALPGAPYAAANMGLPGIGDDEAYQDEGPKTSIAGRAIDEATGGISSWLKGTPEQHELAALMEQRQQYETGLFEKLSEREREERAKKLAEIDAKIAALKSRQSSPAAQPKPNEPVVPRSVDGGGPAMTEPPVPPQGIPGAPGATPPSGGDRGIPTAGPRPQIPSGPGAGGPGGKSGGDAGNGSFASVYGQIKGAIGSGISDELADSKKKYRETLASMKNDKVVDALVAAAKTLAGQRVGSVNYADAVANAGIAAQEAQKRIYKSEDDMRKYRADLMKAQSDGDYKAATIAMSRINNEETNRKGLQTAMMQTSRLIQSQESSEKRANIAAASKEIVTLESKRADLDRMLLDPSKIGIADQKAIETERRRLDAEIAAARANLLYWQTGANPDDIKAELKRRGLI